MWQTETACTPADFDLFFGEYASRIKAAKAICARCPVSGKCLDFALETGVEFGVYGGLTASERQDMLQHA